MKTKLLITLLTICCTSIVTAQFTNFTKRDKIVASDRSALNYYGTTTAISGNYAIVGAPQSGLDIAGSNLMTQAGAAYILERNNQGYWVEVQKITAFDRTSQDEFGRSVTIDGNYLAVGSYTNKASTGNMGLGTKTGGVYIYERNSSTGSWDFVQKITASDRASNDHFGVVAISGNRMIVGAPNASGGTNPNGTTGGGAVYFFERNSAGQWIEQQKYIPNYRSGGDELGYSVAIDGNYAIAGAPGHSRDYGYAPAGSSVGTTFLMQYTTSWQAMPVGLVNSGKSQPASANANARFGSAVDIDVFNGVYCVVGEPSYSDGTGFSGQNLGRAYIASATSAMQNPQILTGDNAFDFIGSSVSLDQGNAVVGCSGGIGKIQLAYYNNTFNSWSYQGQTYRPNNAAGTKFGASVAISGKNVLVGAQSDNTDEMNSNVISNAGAVYVFADCSANSTMIMANACNEYTSPSGNYIWTNSGIYRDTLRDQLACDSILVIDLTIQPIDTNVTVSGTTITNSSQIGTYQWIDCTTNQPIPGATSAAFMPIIGGNYAVVISHNGCSDTSACTAITLTSIGEIQNEKSIYIYPNPANNRLNIALEKSVNSVSVRIINTTGQVVWSKHINTAHLVEVDVQHLNSGVYLVEIETEGGKIWTKFVKSH